MKIGVSCTRNHCFHKCPQTFKSSEIDPKSDPLGAYFGIRSVDLAFSGAKISSKLSAQQSPQEPPRNPRGTPAEPPRNLPESTTQTPAKSISRSQVRSQRAAFWINFSTFGGLVTFVKTVVSCTRNTRFGGLEAHLGEEILGAFLKNVLRRLSGRACCSNSP